MAWGLGLGKFSNWKEILGFHKVIESRGKATHKPPPFFSISVLQEETRTKELKIIMF